MSAGATSLSMTTESKISQDIVYTQKINQESSNYQKALQNQIQANHTAQNSAELPLQQQHSQRLNSSQLNQNASTSVEEFSKMFEEALTRLRAKSKEYADMANSRSEKEAAELKVGPAENADNQQAAEETELDKTILSLEALGQMSWSMVTFEMAVAILQKTDKSAKMLINMQ